MQWVGGEDPGGSLIWTASKIASVLGMKWGLAELDPSKMSEREDMFYEEGSESKLSGG